MGAKLSDNGGACPTTSFRGAWLFGNSIAITELATHMAYSS
jgi:hypothetical protein